MAEVSQDITLWVDKKTGELRAETVSNGQVFRLVQGDTLAMLYERLTLNLHLSDGPHGWKLVVTKYDADDKTNARLFRKLFRT